MDQEPICEKCLEIVWKKLKWELVGGREEGGKGGGGGKWEKGKVEASLNLWCQLLPHLFVPFALQNFLPSYLSAWFQSSQLPRHKGIFVVIILLI